MKQSKRSISNTKHGLCLRSPRIYRIYKNMISRCNNEKSTSFYKYGAKGIFVCNEWQDDILNFEQWAINNGYSDELTIDRINSNDGYYPKNCRWVTTTEQNRNMPNAPLGKIKVRGVNECKTTGRYRAVISVNNKSITIGRADTIEEAAKLRNDYIDKNKLSHLKSEV